MLKCLSCLSLLTLCKPSNSSHWIWYCAARSIKLQVWIMGYCFTYGTLFATERLSAVGQRYNNITCIWKACQFSSGKVGWGESHLSSGTKDFPLIIFSHQRLIPVLYGYEKWRNCWGWNCYISLIHIGWNFCNRDKLPAFIEMALTSCYFC